MSMRKSMDKAMTTLENGTSKVKSFYKFMSGLSFKSKANIDLQLKSKKRLSPIYRFGFNCDKEIKVLPIILAAMGILFIMSMLCSSKDCCDD